MYLPYDISKRILKFRGAYMLSDKKQERQRWKYREKSIYLAIDDLYHYMNYDCDTLESLTDLYEPISQILRCFRDEHIDPIDEIEIPQCHCENCWCFECDQSKYVCADALLSLK